MQFPYSEWAPDAGEATPGILTQALGVQPVPNGYGPARALFTPASATALPDTCKGMFSGFLRDGTNVVIGATATSFYQLAANFAWGSAIGSGYSVTSGDHWSLDQFGIYMMATNTGDGLLAYNLQTPAGFVAVTDAGAPREIKTIANTLVALDCEDDSGNRDNRLIRTSAVGNAFKWSGPGTDYQQVEDGGRLIGAIDLKNNAGLIVQDDAIRAIQFGGTVGAFSLGKIADRRGSVGRRSLTSLDGVAYWLSTDGFVRFSGGSGLERIGAGKVDRWFFNRVDQSRLSEVQVGIDPFNKLIVWRYPTALTTGNVFSYLIGYSWQYGKWFAWEQDTTFLTQIATPGITLDAMGTDYGVLDAIQIPLDDRFWQGGQPVFAALDGDGKYATFTGSYMAGVLETGVRNSPLTGLIGRATPIDDCATGTVELGVKDALASATTWKTGASIGRSGRVPLRGRGMNIAFRRNFPAGASWSYAHGIDHVQGATGGPV